MIKQDQDNRHLAWMGSTRKPILSDNIALCASPVVDRLLVLARNDRSGAALFQDNHPDHRPHKNDGPDH